MELEVGNGFLGLVVSDVMIVVVVVKVELLVMILVWGLGSVVLFVGVSYIGLWMLDLL